MYRISWLLRGRNIILLKVQPISWVWGSTITCELWPLTIILTLILILMIIININKNKTFIKEIIDFCLFGLIFESSLDQELYSTPLPNTHTHKHLVRTSTLGPKNATKYNLVYLRFFFLFLRNGKSIWTHCIQLDVNMSIWLLDTLCRRKSNLVIKKDRIWILNKNLLQ